MAYQNFKELRVWQEAKGLAVTIYKTTSDGKLSKDFGLRDQLQRSSISIASNIAEGYERNSNAEFARFLFISKGSLAELRTQIDIAKDIGYISQEKYGNLEDHCNKIGAMLTKLIQSRKQG